MPIFSCQSDFFRNPRRVYPSRKTILNCFARQSTTCPYSIVNRISFEILGVSTPLAKQYSIVLLGRVPHAHIQLSIGFLSKSSACLPFCKTILNCFARQSTARPYLVVNTTKGTALTLLSTDFFRNPNCHYDN